MCPFRRCPQAVDDLSRSLTRTTLGGQKCGIFLKSRGGKRHFVVSLSGLSGLHPALPPMAESLGVPFPAIFGGEIIENGYITILT